MREEETDLSFAEFDGSKRLYPASTPEHDNTETGNYAKPMARREGFAGERARLGCLAPRGSA
jgi:hypothetical protein